jgi:hypothetical protein
MMGMKTDRPDTVEQIIPQSLDRKGIRMDVDRESPGLIVETFSANGKWKEWFGDDRIKRIR